MFEKGGFVDAVRSHGMLDHVESAADEGAREPHQLKVVVFSLLLLFEMACFG